METKRITVFAGHYGSGKTNLALNYALWLKETRPGVCVVDLDIVNPYFRTADARDALGGKGIKLITSQFAGTNVDAPALPAETQRIFDDDTLYAVVDLGGDDRGALALGRYAKKLAQGGNYEMLLVANRYRPLTRCIEELEEIRREIEAACRVPFTALVNNSNLGGETTPGNVEDSMPYAREAAGALGLPLKMTSVARGVLAQDARLEGTLAAQGGVFPMDIYSKTIWKI